MTVSTAILAVAGAKKTQSIVDACVANPGSRILVLTYTLSSQRDLERRLAAVCTPDGMTQVLGWYSFLLRHWIKPFLPLKYPGRRLHGLNFEGAPRKNHRGVVIASGAERFLDNDSRAYKLFLSKLAIDVADSSDGTVISRLARMFDQIYIDEAQDLTGYDLDIVERLLNSKITVHLVGDIRQSVFDTNPQDPRHPKYRGLGMLDWFEEQHAADRLVLTHSEKTSRFNQKIATFSDSIFDASYNFPPTVSLMTATTAHDGIFTLTLAYVADYIHLFDPVALRNSVATPIPDYIAATNFGLVKGLTFERVLIFSTGPIEKFLKDGTVLAARSACGLYVGATRATHSVAFVVARPDLISLPQWKPSSNDN